MPYLFLILEITVSPPTVLLDFTSSKAFKIVFASYIFLIVFSSDGISEYKTKQQHIADRPGGGLRKASGVSRDEDRW